MDKKIFLEILSKYNSGKASQQEIDMLEAYYDLFDADSNPLDALDANQKLALKLEIYGSITEQLYPTGKEKRSLSYYKWFSAAAILLVLISIGLLLFKNDLKQPVKNSGDLVQVAIKPGSNQATLTLANGATIGLSDDKKGVIVENGGVKVTKNKDGQIVYETVAETEPSMNMVSTPRGGQYQLLLADGTKVWLNAASSIKFPSYFNGNERTVYITGEVYFEVAKNKLKPFIVHTPKQQVEVLGTHFNINTYDDELSETTTLIEGSVKVSRTKNGVSSNGARVLVPGQEASIASNSNQILVEDADLEAAVAWKNGYFKFDKADIQTVMRQISRWYNVDIKYEGKVNNDLFVGKIKRTEDIKGVLRILELSNINTSIKGRTIIINQ